MKPSSSDRRPWTFSPGSGSAATIRTPGFPLSRNLATPISVPPVPIPPRTRRLRGSRRGPRGRSSRRRPRVHLVAVLVRHHEPVVPADELLRHGDRAVRALGTRGVDHLRLERRRRLAPLVGHVVGHDQRDPVALPPADHREGDAGVARRRLEDDAVFLEQPRPRGPRQYFATRSFTEPVGFVASQLAKSRTLSTGDIRGIATIGVWPIAPRMSSYRPPCGASSSWA